MKSIQQALNGAVHEIRQAPRQAEQVASTANTLDAVLTELTKHLRDIRPAWKQALPTTEAVRGWRAQMRLAMMEHGITTLAQIERCLVAARADDSPFWPSIGQLVAWCLGRDAGETDLREAFERCRSKQNYADDVEYATWLEVGFECRRAPIGKDFELFKAVYLRKLAAYQAGQPLPSRNVPLLQHQAPSAFGGITNEVTARMNNSDRRLTSIELRMAKIRAKAKANGHDEA